MALSTSAARVTVHSRALRCPLQRRAVVVRAQDGPGGNWDSAWASIQKQINSNVEIKYSERPPAAEYARKAAPRRVISQSSPAGGWGAQEGERIRKAERVLLDVWSNEDVLKAGTVASIMLALAFVMIVGPPPPDGRCSLYWC